MCFWSVRESLRQNDVNGNNLRFTTCFGDAMTTCLANCVMVGNSGGLVHERRASGGANTKTRTKHKGPIPLPGARGVVRSAGREIVGREPARPG